MIEILSTASLTTVQDTGRFGFLKFGVGASGAMDALALATGNVLLGNEEGAAGIEIPLFPFRVRFTQAIDFVITGADADASLEGTPVLPAWVTHAEAGQALVLRSPSQGVRCYLAVSGGIDVPVVLGSRSTQLRGAFGGLDGRPLKKGDVLPTGVAQASGARPATSDDGAAGRPFVAFGIAPLMQSLPASAVAPPAEATDTVVRVIPAGEYTCYTPESLAMFWKQGWRVTPQSDRYGYRLDGQPLALKASVEMRSHGIVPGVIQVPPSGQPIIQLIDAQPSGGYPKVGTVIQADLWRLAQARIGSRLRFVLATYDEARAALDVRDAYLAKVRRLVALHRGA